MTQPLALLGHPVEHSLSPRIHNAALQALGFEARYEAWDVSPDGLDDAVSRLKLAGYRGANVTVPHKESVIAHVDELSESARAIGAVNTLSFQSDVVVGDNTDPIGFMAPLQEVQADVGAALILGAGGAARSAVYALARDPSISRIVVAARREAQARRLAFDFGDAVETASLMEAPFGEADLIVNTTPVGMWPNVDASPAPTGVFGPHQLVYDLVYNPEETRFLSEARAAGATTIGGLPMLIGQAAASFRIWTGVDMPLEAVLEALGR